MRRSQTHRAELEKFLCTPAEIRIEEPSRKQIDKTSRPMLNRCTGGSTESIFRKSLKNESFYVVVKREFGRRSRFALIHLQQEQLVANQIDKRSSILFELLILSRREFLSQSSPQIESHKHLRMRFLRRKPSGH